MHACAMASRWIIARAFHVVAASALICAASSAFATATGTFTKTFDDTTLVVGGQTRMVLWPQISYTSGSADAFSIVDNLPAGMEVAPAEDQPQYPSTCTQSNSTLDMTPGSHSVTYHWYQYPAHSTTLSCRLFVTVRAVQAGVWTNTASATSSSDAPGGGTGVTVTGSATLTVIGPPVLARTVSGFHPGTTDGTSWAVLDAPLTLHYTLTNPNPTTTLTGVGFTESLPAGLAVAAGIIDNTCGGTATSSAGSIVLGGVQLAPGASCTLEAGVSAGDAGTYTLSTAPTSVEAGTGSAVATTFDAFTQPQVWISTNPPSGAIDLDGTGTMTLNAHSTTTVDVGGLGFTATLPPGLAVADGSFAACGGGATTTAASGSLTLSGATVPAGGDCNVTFTVTGTQVGDLYVDSVATVHGAVVRADFGAYFAVRPLATTTTLVPTPAAAVHGQSVTFTAAVALPGGNPRPAVGTVAFTEDGNPLPGCAGAVSVAAGSAACTTSALPVAPHHVTATFTPTDGNTAASAGSADIAVGKAATTTTIANAQPWAITLGASTPVNVTVTPNAPGAGTPTGTVTVSDGAGAECTIVSLASGSGNCTLTPISAGTKPVTATFVPDAASAMDLTGSAALASLAVDRSQPGAVLTSSANPSAYGQPVTLTGILTPATGGVAPGGVVHFRVDGVDVCADATLTAVGFAVSASCVVPQASLGVGSHPLRFEYDGDANNLAASASLVQTVGPAQTTTVVTAPASAELGSPVTIDVAVSANAPGAGTPSGDVAVSIGSQVCHATLDAAGTGHCALTPSAPAGARTVTATYGGAVEFATSSGTTTLQVGAAPTTTTLSVPATAVYEENVTFTATVALPGGNAGAVAGSVAFTENGIPLPGGCASAVAVSSGIASCTTQALAVSATAHVVVATFMPGDGDTTGSTGSADITVGRAATTTTITNAQPWTITFGDTTTVSVTVAANAPSLATPTGTVTVSDGDAGSGDQCTITLPDTHCALTPTGAGTRTLTATYTPNAGASANITGSEATAALTIERADQAALSLVATPDLLIPHMTSQLAASGGSGSGAISFAVDSGPCSISGAVASATGVGTCVVRADKAGDANYTAASATTTITVQAANLPAAQSQTASTLLNTALAIQLVGSDDNIGGPYALTYAIVDAPANGAIGGLDAAAGTLTYTPAGDFVGADSFTFTVSSSNGVSQAATVVIQVAAPSLALSIEDGRDYARYGQLVDYGVTLTNAGDAANAVPVWFALSPGLDAQAANLACIGATDGASCDQDPADPLRFTVTLPPGHTLTWLVSVPVHGDAADETVTLRVEAIGADSVADTNTLVIFRDGFDVVDGDGTQVAPVIDGKRAEAILAGDSASGGQATAATVPIRVPDSATTARSPEAWLIVRAAAREVRVEGRAVAGTTFVRLRERDAGGGERASAWSIADSGTVLILGAVVGEGGQRIVLLEGARESLVLH